MMRRLCSRTLTRLTIPKTAGRATCGPSDDSSTPEAASRFRKPQGVRPGRRPLGQGRLSASRFRKPQGVRQDAVVGKLIRICRLTIPKTAGRATPGCRCTHESWSTSASRFRKPQGARLLPVAIGVITFLRLTIPKTAGRATSRPDRSRARPRPASRFRKPQGVRHPTSRQPTIITGRLTIPKTAGRATCRLEIL